MYIEDVRIARIASTTETPDFYIYGAVLSRCTVFEFKAVGPSEVEKAVHRGFEAMEEELGVPIEVSPEVEAHIARACGGDVREALNSVEMLALSSDRAESGGRKGTMERAKELSPRSAVRDGRGGGEH